MAPTPLKCHTIGTLVLLLLASSSGLPALAQQAEREQRLWKQWTDTTAQDTVRLNALSAIISEHYLPSAPDSAFPFIDRMEALAKARGLDLYMGEAANLRGNIYFMKGDLGSAQMNYEASLTVSRKIGDEWGIGIALSNLGAIKQQRGDMAGAIADFTEALRSAERSGNQGDVASFTLSIGDVYESQGDTTRAIAHYREAQRILEKVGERSRLAGAYTKLGVLFSDIERAQEALDLHTRALRIREELGEQRGMAQSHNNLGNGLRSLGQYSEAAEHYELAKATYTAVGEERGIASVLNNLGYSHMLQGHYPKAIALGQEAMEHARRAGNAQQVKNAHELLYESYRRSGDQGRALDAYIAMIALRDSLRNEQVQEEMIRQEFDLTYERREATLKAEQDKQDAVAAAEIRRQKVVRNAFMGGFAIVGLFAGVFFFQRNRISKARKRSDELLLNILPEEVAEELKDTGAAAAKQFDSATILFSDFKGFTQASEKMSPQELVEELNTCFKAFDNIITARGIEKIKTIGDAYMCVGGLPDPKSSSPADVVKAALEMQSFMQQRKAVRDASGLPAFEMRVGIHTGPVVAGIVGVKKFQYDIWGDTVNIASRMESSGEVGQVNISEATYALVKNAPGFTFSPRGKVPAKGKGEIEMYFVSTSN